MLSNKPYVITEEGGRREATPSNGKYFTLRNIQEIVGCKNIAYHSAYNGLIIVTKKTITLFDKVNVQASLLILKPETRLYGKVLVLPSNKLRP